MYTQFFPVELKVLRNAERVNKKIKPTVNR